MQVTTWSTKCIYAGPRRRVVAYSSLCEMLCRATYVAARHARVQRLAARAGVLHMLVTCAQLRMTWREADELIGRDVLAASYQSKEACSAISRKGPVAPRRWLLDTFGRDALAAGAGVLDVADGKGALAFELANLNGLPATVLDPRPLALGRHILLLQARLSGLLRVVLTATHRTTPALSWLPYPAPEEVHGLCQFNGASLPCSTAPTSA